MRTSTRNAVIFIIVCVVVLVVWALRPRPEPPETAINDQMNYAVAAANAHSAGRLMAIISQDYSDNNNLTTTSLRVLLARGFNGATDAKTTTTPPVIVVNGNSATSDSTIAVSGSGGQSYFNRPVHLQWREEKGTAWLIFPIPVWRVIHADYGEALDSGG